MVLYDSTDIKRKLSAILRVLSEAREPLGARIIARQLETQGISLSERAVRYHLQLMDERGLTQGFGRDGRLITPAGREELKNALVSDKVGFVISKIELLAFATTFDIQKCCGFVPVNISFFPREKLGAAVEAMKVAFNAGLCVADRVAVAREGERLGDTVVPPGKVGLATVCSISVNGTLLRNGVPMDSRFGGVLEMRNGKPLRFVELISYAGSSVDPSSVFIRGRMTSVREAASRGDGKILANFREIPAPCRPLAEAAIQKLREAGVGGLVIMGQPNEPVCEIPVGLNRVGVVLLGGLNPVAAAEEAGVQTENRAMSTTLEYSALRPFGELAGTVYPAAAPLVS
ncbi:MAG: DUF128 domain-containing protein [Chloroflexi bacterium]|nr:DUF128 domain-containing protein [Chloroflexota bacterium]